MHDACAKECNVVDTKEEVIAIHYHLYQHI